MNMSQRRNKVYSLSDMIADQEAAPVDIIGHGVLPRESVLMIVGRQKVGKSLFVTNLALHLVAGREFLSFPVDKPQRVLYLTAEGGYYMLRERARKMAQSLGLAHEELRRFDAVPYPDVCMNGAEIPEALKTMIEETEPDVVIIDPLVKFHNSDENSAKEMSAVLRGLRKLTADYGVSVVLVHHQGKGENGNVRGSSAISGEYDSCMMLSKEKNSSHSVKVGFELRHAEAPRPFDVQLDGDSLTFQLAGQTAAVPFLLVDGPKRKKELVAQIRKETGLSKSSAYDLIKAQETSGRLRRTEDGLLCLPRPSKN
jgi:RecA-family ATPase